MEEAKKYYNWHNRCQIIKKVFKDHELEFNLFIKKFGVYFRIRESWSLMYYHLYRRHIGTESYYNPNNYRGAIGAQVVNELNDLYGLPNWMTSNIDKLIIKLDKGGKLK